MPLYTPQEGTENSALVRVVEGANNCLNEIISCKNNKKIISKALKRGGRGAFPSVKFSFLCFTVKPPLLPGRPTFHALGDKRIRIYEPLHSYP